MYFVLCVRLTYFVLLSPGYCDVVWRSHIHVSHTLFCVYVSHTLFCVYVSHFVLRVCVTYFVLCVHITYFVLLSPGYRDVVWRSHVYVSHTLFCVYVSHTLFCVYVSRSLFCCLQVIVMWYGDHTFTRVEPERLKSWREGLVAHHKTRRRRKYVRLTLRETNNGILYIYLILVLTSMLPNSKYWLGPIPQGLSQ